MARKSTRTGSGRNKSSVDIKREIPIAPEPARAPAPSVEAFTPLPLGGHGLFSVADVEPEPEADPDEALTDTGSLGGDRPRLSIVRGDEREDEDEGLIELAPVDPPVMNDEAVHDSWPWLADDGKPRSRREPTCEVRITNEDQGEHAPFDLVAACIGDDHSAAADLIVTEQAAPTACGAMPTAPHSVRRPMPSLPKMGEIAGIAQRLGASFADEVRSSYTPPVPSLGSSSPRPLASVGSLGLMGGSSVATAAPSIPQRIDTPISAAPDSFPSPIAEDKPTFEPATAASLQSTEERPTFEPAPVASLQCTEECPAIEPAPAVSSQIAEISASIEHALAAIKESPLPAVVESVKPAPSPKPIAAPLTTLGTPSSTPKRIGSGKLVPVRVTWKPGDPLAEKAPTEAVPGRFRWELMLTTACGTAACGMAFFWLMRAILS